MLLPKNECLKKKIGGKEIRQHMMIQIFSSSSSFVFGEGGGNEFFFGPKTKRGGGKNWIGKFNSIKLSSLFLCLCTQRLPLYTRASTHFERRRKRTLFFVVVVVVVDFILT